MQATDRRSIGKSGLSTTILGLGGAPLGDLFQRVPEKQARATIETAFGLGLRLFDTAPLYGTGLSEHRIGAALRQRPEVRDGFLLSTKVGRYLLPQRKPEVDHGAFKGGLEFRSIVDYSYDGTMRALEQSFQRLGMNQIDIVHIHDVDVTTWGEAGFKERFREASDGAFRALSELRSQGVIRAIGVGVNDVQPLVQFAQTGDFDCFMLAGRYTLLEQEALDKLLPLCARRGISILVAAPYNSGILATGPKPGAVYNYKPASPAVLERVARIEEVANRYGIPLAATAIQFPLGHPVVSAVVPGAINPKEVEANAGLLGVPIPADFWSEIKAKKLLREDAPIPKSHPVV